MNKLKMQFAENGRGEKARLFPVLSDSSKEGRAASIFLATLQSVPEFADALLKPIGRSVGKRTKLACRTEVVLKTDPKLRPDGLILIDTGHVIWTALLEFKVAGLLETDQVEKYLKLAKDNDIDALITVSNDIVQDPVFSPIKVDGRLTKTVSLYHFSWMHIATMAELVLSADTISDLDQKMILEEFGRFLRHKSTGVKGYEAMPTDWPDVVKAIRNKTLFTKKDLGPANVALGWSQEERDISFLLSSKIGKRCQVKLSRLHANNHQARLDHHNQTLLSDGILQTSVFVPNAAGTLDVELDLRSRCVSVSQIIKAPSDRKRASASLNWLLRQIPEEAKGEHIIKVNWPGRSIQTSASLHQVRDRLEMILDKETGLLHASFEIAFTSDLGASFKSRKKIIAELERSVSMFYDAISQHIRPFIPPPLKTRESGAVDTVVDESERLSEKLEAALEESLFGE